MPSKTEIVSGRTAIAVKAAKVFSQTDQLLVNYPEQDEESCSDSDTDNDLDDYVYAYDESSDDDKL